VPALQGCAALAVVAAAALKEAQTGSSYLRLQK